MDGTGIIEKYQIAGLDERERGFSRLMEMERVSGRYRAVLQYEKLTVNTDACETSDDALNGLIRLLRERGFSQLKSRLDFRGSTYLGSQEPWTDYPDPDRPTGEPDGQIAEQLARRTGWIGRVLRQLCEYVKR